MATRIAIVLCPLVAVCLLQPVAREPTACCAALLVVGSVWLRFRNRAGVVDLGGRLGAGRLALPDAAPDGPFVEVKELVGGYMIVSAADLNEAIEVARQCPGLMRPGSGVEVIEIHSPG